MGLTSLLVGDSGYVENPEELVKQFWKDDVFKRREPLMFFFEVQLSGKVNSVEIENTGTK